MNRINVYITSINRENRCQAAKMSVILPSKELERIKMIRNQKIKNQSIISSVLRRYFLSHFCNWQVKPWEWEFSTEKNHKPIIRGVSQRAKISFNISHCDGLFAMAISNSKDIGIDIESFDFAFDLDFAKTVFSENEIPNENLIQNIDIQKSLMQLWTMKEAFYKYLGIGVGAECDFKSLNFIEIMDMHIPVLNIRELQNASIYNTSLRDSGNEYSLSLAMHRCQLKNNIIEVIQFSTRDLINLFSGNSSN